MTGHARSSLNREAHTAPSTALDGENTQQASVRQRLIAAASAEFDERGGIAIPMEAVARRAGVSRATAFRQLGNVTELVLHVALFRAQQHISAVQELMRDAPDSFTKIELALIYCARELPNDAVIAALMRRGSASVNDSRVHAAAVGAMAAVIEQGQRDREVRDDVSLDVIVDYLVEQTYLAAEHADRSADWVAHRFRTFVVPALAARGPLDGAVSADLRRIKDGIATAEVALSRLHRRLPS